MTDFFSRRWRVLTTADMVVLRAINEKADELLDLFLKIHNREMSLAITNLEQAVTWANKAVFIDSEIKDDLI